MTFRLAALGLVATATLAGAQPTMAPTNSAPNPYRSVEGWAKLPDGRTWGSASGVDVDRDGRSIWVAERCGTNSCLGSPLAPILLFDAKGEVVRSFGAGIIQSPHGLTIDAEGNVWVVDCSCTRAAAGVPADSLHGHQVFKFSRTGTLLMSLGTPGGGRGAGYFWQPNDVLVAPNGNLFVSEGHSSAPGSTARVYKFSADGKLLKSWGQLGAGDDDFNQPHALAMDSRGRLFVGDRGNNRIVIFDQDGRRLDTWYQFSRPSGIAIDAKDRIYIADSESGSVDRTRTAWKRGIRVGSAKDGTVSSFIPDPAENPPSTSAAEGVAVDRAGNIYGAEVGPKRLMRYELLPRAKP